jgi:hypothetical protein
MSLLKRLASPSFCASLGGQVALVLLAWGYLCGLHWDNDGLWFQGDAPRHAGNGLFWKDYLSSLSADPRTYALSYYARYPVIQPTTYPPAFHILEAAAFALFGPSPYVAKGLVLLFALAAGLYTTAWLRHAVAPEAGWAGALVLLLPGPVRWSHAIMLNVPAFALLVGALYHGRRWLESPPGSPVWGQLYALAALGVLAVLTYYPAAVGAFILLAWLAALRRWDLLRHPRTLLVGIAAALLVLPVAWMVTVLAPTHVSYVTSITTDVEGTWSWSYYPSCFGEVVSPYLTALAAAGVIAGLREPRWRRETVLLLLWIAVTYGFFSGIAAKESRYVLPVVTPFVCLALMAVLAIAQVVAAVAPEWGPARWAIGVTAIAALLRLQAYLAARTPVPEVRGFTELVGFFAEVAPNEPVLYAGNHEGVFTFYLRAADPDYHRRVVLGRELLDGTTPRARASLAASAVGVVGSTGGPLLAASAIVPGRDGPLQVLDILKRRGGCRWFALEEGEPTPQTVPPWGLRAAVREPPFELVRTFAVTGKEINRVEVYRLRIPVEQSEDADLFFPSRGEEGRYRIRPIPSRRHRGS